MRSPFANDRSMVSFPSESVPTAFTPPAPSMTAPAFSLPFSPHQHDSAAAQPGPGGPRWARRKDQRPSEVLAAALDVFVRRGYAATRLEDVASRAGVSKGTVYLYFSNKEELFKALVRETIVVEIDRFGREMADSTVPAAEQVRAALFRWWDVFGSTQLGGIAKLIIAEAGNFPALAQFFHDEVFGPSQRLLEHILESGMDRGELRRTDAAVMARLLLAPLLMKTLWQQSFVQHCKVDSDIEPQRLLATHLDMTLSYLSFDRT